MAPISALAPNFTLTEFEVASRRPLTLEAKAHATWHAEHLQRVRNAINDTYPPPDSGGEWRIAITSFVRDTGQGDHASGAAVDWNVRDSQDNRDFELSRWARDWLAVNDAHSFAELLWEDDHVHHARRGFSRDDRANQTPQILDKTAGGWVVASINVIPRPVRPLALAVLIGAGLYWLSKVNT